MHWLLPEGDRMEKPDTNHDSYMEIQKVLQQNRDRLTKLGREMFHHPETGFKEVESNKILTSFLCMSGIACQSDLCLTGIRATIGSGEGYHIALVADMDALTVNDGNRSYPWHSCGHSIQTAVMACVLTMLNEMGIAERTGGRISFIAAPAEEFTEFEFRQQLKDEGKINYFSGKQNMIEQGIFDDVDCVISMHINGETETLFDVGSTLAGFMVKKAIFTGQASHSGVAAHMGLNALHGASLCMNAISYMKDQFPKEAGLQIHPIITECGGSVNIVPEKAVLESYVRANTLDDLLNAGEKFDQCAVHSAKALGLSCRVKNQTGYMPLRQSDELNEIIYRHMLEICPDEKIVKHVVSGASGDVGDLGYLLPTVQFGFSGIKGRIHSSDFTISDEENVYMNTAEIVMKTVCDILTSPRYQIRNHDFDERKEFYLKNWLYKEQ